MASAPPDLFFKILSRSHTFLYRLSGGKIGKNMQGMPVLLLTTTGRKSGQPRTTTLVYVRDGDDYLLAASKGGADSHPAWYFNLEVEPEVGVQVGDQEFTASVTITEGEERTQLYERFKSLSDEYVKYEQMTQRTIPVVRLMPI